MEIFDKVSGYKNGWMKQFIKENGIIIKLKVEEYFGMLKETYILVILRMIKQMAMVCISTLTAADTMVNG